VIAVPEECQRGYGINFVNLGNSHLVCCDEQTKALLEAHPQFAADGGRVTYMPYDGVTAMYGGPHCSSQLFRTPRAANESDANLISRLGEEFDAVAASKPGRNLRSGWNSPTRVSSRQPTS